ncbi:MAG TPA: uracil-DNA glycosylase family protein, partial [Burkholderiaceae bacterium]|nr:uracil-DNA glycosylase family protein [Burkholderiaceae bacterium]
MDTRRARLWQAMGLGPIYTLRSVSEIAPNEADITPHVSDRSEMIGRLDWKELRNEVAGCRACSLCETRKQTVFGIGNTHADWMLIGEAPGAEEDMRGEPFVGQAGRL